METEWVSILENIKKGGFEASVITTYNAYLPFYEEVVLRHLVSSGCRHNVLVMDAGQLGECLSQPVSRPQLAGHAYTIIPVWAKGAFHPKVALLAAKRKGLLLVGSHNMTLSGWGLNKELTSCISFADNDPAGVQLASHAWSFLRTWVAEASGRLPALLPEAFFAFRQFAPWLNESPPPSESDLSFFGATPDGDSLWSQVFPAIKGSIKRVTVMGPFFDNRLEFLETIKRDLQPRETVVGVEPGTVMMPEVEPKKASFKLVDASQVPNSSGYLHAKAIYIEGSSGERWLVTGSANPSHPAWDADPGERNAEAVLLHSGKAAEATAKKLGIAGLKVLTPLATEDWKALRAQVRHERPKADRVRYLVGIAKEGCVQISKGAFPEGDFLKATAIGDHQRVVGEFTNSEVTENHLSPGGDGHEAWSDEFIRVTPGQDRFLATAVCRTLFESGHVIADLDSVATNWPAFRKVVKARPTAELAKACGVGQAEVERLADDAGQYVVQIMSHPAGKGADDFHFFGLHELLFEFNFFIFTLLPGFGRGVRGQQQALPLLEPPEGAHEGVASDHANTVVLILLVRLVCVPSGYQGEQAVGLSKGIHELRPLNAAVLLLVGPDEPGVKRVVSRPIGDVGDPRQQPAVDVDARGLRTQVVQSTCWFRLLYPTSN